jgi:ABC-type transport system involved in multi-copper enzyme maturation permease subunit
MNSTYVIARRELAEKRFVFTAAFAFAILTLLLPFVVRHENRGVVLATTSAIFAVGFALGLATILGATVVGRELSDNRLSFYFARPVPAASIWFGKLAASAILIAVSFFIIGTPALVAGIGTSMKSWAPNTLAAFGIVAGAAAVFFFGAHVIGTMVRSRSAWIALDFACAAATVLAVRAMLMVPLQAVASTITEVASITMASGLAIVVIAGGAWQLSRGRTDRRLSYIALSRFLWSGVTMVLIVGAAYVLWAISVTPADLVEFHGVQGGPGWALIGGRATSRGDYQPTFLTSLDGRQTLRITTPPWWGYDFSRDGKTAVWAHPDSLSHDSFELVRCQLGSSETQPVPVPTGITTSPWSNVALSGDGSRVAVGRSSFSVYELATKRSLGSFRVEVPPDSWTHAYFVGPDLVRLLVQTRRHGDEPMRPSPIYEYDLKTHLLRQSGIASGWFRTASPDGSRMTVWTGGEISVADASTGATLISLGRAGTVMPRFLADGNLVVSAMHEGRAMLRRLSPEGTVLQEVLLTGYGDAWVAGGDAHRVLLQVQKGKSDVSMLALVDLDRGVIEKVEPSLRFALNDPSQPLGAEILAASATGVVAWNPATGGKRLIAGK